MPRLITRLLLIAALTVFAVTLPGADAAKPKKHRVLIVSGDDVVPAHNWREMTQATREVLDNAGRFEVRVSEDMFILESPSALRHYDVVYFARYNREGTLSDLGKENLLNFVKQGGGFVVSHLASASFKEWTEFRRLCGRYWVMGTSGHGPRGVFKAVVVDRNHPITLGLQDFETDDELYAKLQGDVPIHILLQADSDWSKKTEPLAFIQNYGEGRVFHHTFGHDAKATLQPSVATLIARGVEWAATGKVE
jgi:hypothetical protein